MHGAAVTLGVPFQALGDAEVFGWIENLATSLIERSGAPDVAPRGQRVALTSKNILALFQQGRSLEDACDAVVKQMSQSVNATETFNATNY